MQKYDFRTISLKILTDVFKTFRWAKESIDENINIIDGNHGDIKKIYELTYGILRNKNLIDYFLSRYIKRPVSDIMLQNILRIGYYQLNFMNSIPPYAAINTCVDLAKNLVSPKTSDFVNAVLRNILRYKNEKVEIQAKDKIEYFSIKYSYELWMIKFFLKYYDEKTVENILKSGNEKPPIFIRTNLLKIKSSELENEIKKQNILIKPVKILKNAFLFEKGDPIKTLAFEKGLFYIQDLSSQILGYFVDAKSDEIIMDIASAPGGKTIYCAINMKNKGKIISIELKKERILMMERNLQRLGITNVEIIEQDATSSVPGFKDKCDKMILDAPCSGLGVIRRHPEKKWCLKEDILNFFPNLQMELLVNIKNWVKKGGFLFYSTCTINPEENENLIKKFLKENKNFKLCNLIPPNTKLKDYKKEDFFLSLPGNKDNADGFFIAKLKRIS